MKIINRDQYTNLCDAVYKGRIELTRDEFRNAVNSILTNKEVSNEFQGAGKYPYLSKELLKEDISKGKDGIFCLRVSFADYITDLYKNTSRYQYKRQNYLIKIVD